MHPGFWIGLGLISGFCGLLWLGVHRMKAAERARSKSPFSEKLRRPAGESLRLKLE